MSDIQKKECCLECGGEIAVNPKTGIPECIYCHRQYTSGVEGYDDDLQEIMQQRQLREFIKAEELCEELLKAQPESCEAHWQALLSKLGVVYVEEEGKKKPTFFSCSYDDRESILDDEYYRAAVRYAPTAEAKAYYEYKARELDTLLKEFFSLVKKEANYDIFISFKHTVSVPIGGEMKTFETDDCRKAREIYEHFKDRYNVFFSPVSIGEDTGIQGEKYEPRILKALQSSQAMILVGFTEENLKAQWVENEWRRYKYYIDKGKKRKDSLIYVYEKSMKLPTALREIQLPNVDIFEGKYLDQLEKKLAFVETKKGLKSSISGKKLNTSFETAAEDIGYSNTTRTVITAKGNKQSIKVDSTEDRDLKTAFDMLTHGQCGDAEKRFKYILRRNPESHQAHYGLFMARIKAKNEKAIPTALCNANPPDYQHLDNAIANSPDEDFSWGIIDTLIDGFRQTDDWKKQKLVFEFLVKYVDVPRIEKLHDIIKDVCTKHVSLGNVKVSEEMFECARNIFIEEVKEHSIALMSAYADALLSNMRYALARKYFEQLAGIRNSSATYFDLLAARLHTTDPTEARFKLVVNDNDNAAVKRPADLDIDEIIERIVICDSRERAWRVAGITYKLTMPCYKVLVRGGSSVTAVTSAIRSATGYNLTEAKNFIAKHKVTDVHTTWIEACEAMEALESIGVEIDRIDKIGPPKGKDPEPATKNQIIAAVQFELDCDFEEAKQYVNENKLYSKSYSSREEIDAVIDKLYDIGVRDVGVFEDDPNKGLDLDAPTETYTKLCKMLMNQVYNNTRNVHPFMETIVSCYRQLGDKKQLIDIMYRVAEAFIEVKDFKQANTWYNELIIEDANDARAHWGTLKCKLKAINDYAVAKHHKKLMGMQEFNNAINCADNDQHKHYMSVYYNEIPKPDKKKGNRRSGTGDIKGFIKRVVGEIFGWALMAAYFVGALITVYDPSIYFKRVHFGWVIAAGVILIGGSLISSRAQYKRAKDAIHLSPTVQNGRVRYAAIMYLLMSVSAIVFTFGMLTAGNRTYAISTPEDFALMKNAPFASKADYVLENDIDFGGNECVGYGVIKEYSGTFDGRGYTLKNIYIDDFGIDDADGSNPLHEYSYGFVKTLTEDGKICNLNLENCLIQGINKSYDVYSEDIFVGVLAGVNGGEISDCSVIDSYLMLENTRSDNTSVYLGGIAGAMASKLSYYDYDTSSSSEWIYGNGKITGCTFFNRNDLSDLYDDDNYEFAFVILRPDEYSVNGIAYGYEFSSGEEACEYKKTTFSSGSYSSALNKTFVEIFGAEEDDENVD